MRSLVNREWSATPWATSGWASCMSRALRPPRSNTDSRFTRHDMDSGLYGKGLDSVSSSISNSVTARRNLGFMSDIDPIDLARALGEVPLFRELQRLLAAQSGPVNWEIASQIAQATSGAGGQGPAPSEEETAELDAACRAAELRVVDHTGLEPTAATQAILLDRGEWAEANRASFGPLIDRLATRLGGQMQPEGGQLGPAAMFGALAPFLLGLQVGFLLGYLSRRVLGQYDLCYPAPDSGRLYFVHPNIVQIEKELGFDPAQFRMWLALHEVTHQLEFQSIPWTRNHFVALLETYVDGAEVDSAEVTERLRGIADPDQLERLMQHPDELLPLLMSPAQQKVLEEIQAFMSVLEGFAEWTMMQVGNEILTEFEKMREGITRSRAERTSVERMLEQLIGLDLKREQYRAGEKFVRSVGATDEGLKRLWETPANLPTLDEVSEPTKWLSRVLFS